MAGLSDGRRIVGKARWGSGWVVFVGERSGGGQGDEVERGEEGGEVAGRRCSLPARVGRLLFPAATRRSTSMSRVLSPPGPFGPPAERRPPIPRRRGCAAPVR